MLCKIQISEAYFENFSVPVWKKKKELAKCFIFRLKFEACMRSNIPFNFRCIPSALLFLCIGSFSMFADICPSCKQSYPDFTRLAVHCALEHGTWLCPKCPQTFHVKDRKSYWHHRIKEHLEAVCFACNLRAFRDPREWERHRKTAREGQFSFELKQRLVLSLGTRTFRKPLGSEASYCSFSRILA